MLPAPRLAHRTIEVSHHDSPVSLVTHRRVLLSSAASQTIEGPVSFGSGANGEKVEAYTLVSPGGVRLKLVTLGATIAELHAPPSGATRRCRVWFRRCDRVSLRSQSAFWLHNRSRLQSNCPGQVHARRQDVQLGDQQRAESFAWRCGAELWARQLARREAHQRARRGGEVHLHEPRRRRGLPGKLDVAVTYTLTAKNEVVIEYEARADRATPVNLTNHSYFNLGGAGQPSALDHELTLAADQYTPVDATLIPTGMLASVTGTPLDFTKPTRVGERIGQLTETDTKGYDHNFVLRKRESQPTFAAKLRDPASGRTLTVLTTQPGIQFYTGNFLKGQNGKQGRVYAQRSGVCLETQHFPDSINQPTFPSIVIKPGDVYRQSCVYALGIE